MCIYKCYEWFFQNVNLWSPLWEPESNDMMMTNKLTFLRSALAQKYSLRVIDVNHQCEIPSHEKIILGDKRK